MRILDRFGRPLADRAPRVVTGEFCRNAHFEGPATVVTDSETGQAVVRNELVRAQVPYLVNLLTYNSQFQLEPDRHEFFVYAPGELTMAVKLAFDLWRWWWKGVPVNKDTAGMEIPEWPKADDGAAAEPIDDAFFLDTWKYVKQKKHRAAGHPDDPFAFTSLDDSVRIYRAADFLEGMPMRF